MMHIPRQRRSLQTLACLILAVTAACTPVLRLPGIDRKADAYFRDVLRKAAFAYAACRIINAGVSVLKHSSLELEPAGVGFSLAAGEAVDPIDDMTERTSDVLVTAIAALGVQKLVYEIAVGLAPRLLAILLSAFAILLWMEGPRSSALRRTVVRFGILVGIVRISLPLSAAVDGVLNHEFFTPKITEARERLGVLSGFDKLFDFDFRRTEPGLLATIKQSAVFTKRKSEQLKAAFQATLKNAVRIIENLLALTFLYAGVVAIQVLALPLLVFWVMVRLAGALLPRPGPFPHSRGVPPAPAPFLSPAGGGVAESGEIHPD